MSLLLLTLWLWGKQTKRWLEVLHISAEKKERHAAIRMMKKEKEKNSHFQCTFLHLFISKLQAMHGVMFFRKGDVFLTVWVFWFIWVNQRKTCLIQSKCVWCDGKSMSSIVVKRRSFKRNRIEWASRFYLISFRILGVFLSCFVKKQTIMSWELLRLLCSPRSKITKTVK